MAVILTEEVKQTSIMAAETVYVFSVLVVYFNEIFFIKMNKNAEVEQVIKNVNVRKWVLIVLFVINCVRLLWAIVQEQGSPLLIIATLLVSNTAIILSCIWASKTIAREKKVANDTKAANETKILNGADEESNRKMGIGTKAENELDVLSEIAKL